MAVQKSAWNLMEKERKKQSDTINNKTKRTDYDKDCNKKTKEDIFSNKMDLRKTFSLKRWREEETEWKAKTTMH